MPKSTRIEPRQQPTAADRFGNRRPERDPESAKSGIGIRSYDKVAIVGASGVLPITKVEDLIVLRYAIEDAFEKGREHMRAEFRALLDVRKDED